MVKIDSRLKIYPHELVEKIRLEENADTPHGYMVVVEDETGIPASIFETLLWLKYVQAKSELDALKVKTRGQETRT